MKNLKLYLGEIAITIFSLQPISSALAFEEEGICKPNLLGEGLVENKKNRFLASGCKHKCLYVCNANKRDIDLTISFKL